jgi:hypothetical protein
VEVPDLYLGVVPNWIEAHCVIPDQDHRGEPFELGSEQLVFVANHYAVKAAAERGQRADAFVFRRSQLIRAQKWGKSPLIAAFVCVEGVGPVLFDGFAHGGEAYDCRDFGCGCGFWYEYEPGEPMGRPWSTPLIQITATSEDQTDNTYDALRPMIELGPLADVIPKTGEEFIRLPNGGRIDAVTSKANSRLGQRITFAAQDETGLWVASNGGHKLARTQRRGLAGMGGRSIETSNAWDPAQDSVAQQTFESSAKDVNRDFRKPPPHLKFAVKAERHLILEFNYAGAPWVSRASIEAEAAELVERDPAEAERFFGNRDVAGSGRWLETGDVAVKMRAIEVKPRTRVALGFDGSDNDDFTGIRLETLDFHQFTPVYGDKRLPTFWKPQDWQGRVPKDEVRAAVAEIVNEYEIVRGYLDPFLWETEIDEWAGLYGEKRFIKWETNRPKAMYYSLERFRSDLRSGPLTLSVDKDFEAAANNAVVRSRVLDVATGRRQYILGKASEPQKIDLAMSGVLAHEAAADAVADGQNNFEPTQVLILR